MTEPRHQDDPNLADLQADADGSSVMMGILIITIG